MPKVSILLPVRDAAQTLEAAIESIRKQTLEDWEMIVIDDHSSDQSVQIGKAASRTDPRIRWQEARGKGIVCALNEGLSLARGNLIARMDADDRSKPKRLEKQCGLLRNCPELGLVSCLTFQGEGGGKGYQRYMDWTNSVRSPEEHFLQRFVESPVAHPSVIYRRELVERFGGYRAGDFPEDYELWLRWMNEGVRFEKVPEFLLEWNDSSERLSRTDPRYRPEAFYRTKCEYLHDWLDEHVASDRPLWLWGAGRVTRRRFQRMEQLGKPFAGFLDIDPRKIGSQIEGRRVENPVDADWEDGRFVLLGVGVKGARELAGEFCEKRGLKLGRDYLAAA